MSVVLLHKNLSILQLSRYYLTSWGVCDNLILNVIIWEQHLAESCVRHRLTFVEILYRFVMWAWQILNILIQHLLQLVYISGFALSLIVFFFDR